ATFLTYPDGKTSTSFAVKSVSGADDAAHSTTLIGPVTSTSASSGGVEYTRTSGRHSAVRWSRGPIEMGVMSSPQQVLPPSVGTGSAGSYTYRSGGSAAGALTSRAPSPHSVFAWPPEWK